MYGTLVATLSVLSFLTATTAAAPHGDMSAAAPIAKRHGGPPSIPGSAPNFDMIAFWERLMAAEKAAGGINSILHKRGADMPAFPTSIPGVEPSVNGFDLFAFYTQLMAAQQAASGVHNIVSKRSMSSGNDESNAGFSHPMPSNLLTWFAWFMNHEGQSMSA